MNAKEKATLLQALNNKAAVVSSGVLAPWAFLDVKKSGDTYTISATHNRGEETLSVSHVGAPVMDDALHDDFYEGLYAEVEYLEM